MQADLVASLKLPRKPYDHQAEEWGASLNDPERLLGWEMGTGKTVTAIGWLRLKWRRYAALEPTLILAPLATMSGWKKEFEANAPENVHTKFVVAAGMGKKKMSGKKRAELILKPDSMIVATNFASLTMPDVLAALAAKKFKYLVVDEIDEFKGWKSKRLANLLPISDAATFRLGLTGTFLTQGYMDIWGPCRILDKGRRFEKNFYHFRRKYFVDVNAGNHFTPYPDWQPRPGIGEEITAKLSSLMSHKKKEECLSLPPRVFMQEEVELGDDQQKAYDEMEAELVAEVMSGEATASNALVKMLRMRQILSGFLPVAPMEDPDAKSVHYFKSNPRLERLRQLAEQIGRGRKIVVWSNFQAIYPKLHEMARDMGRGYAEYTGQTKNKDEEKRRFIEDPDCDFFFGNPQAGGVGVDGLQHVCDYSIYYDRSHSLRYYLQSRDRVHRSGSEVHTSVTEMHLLAPQTIDEDIHAALVRKENFADNVLERLRSRYGHGRRS